MKEKEKINKVFLGMGSNLGNREDYLITALNKINKLSYTKVNDYSSIYETKPISKVPQDKYLNMVAVITTKFNPLELLSKLQGIEKDLGRERKVRWGARTIDIDILLYNDETIDLSNLIVPHPRMFERSFVLVPLIEVVGKEVMGININDINNKIFVDDEVAVFKTKSKIKI